MFIENVDKLVSILQASIAPVTMISGIGLLLLSMTNRYGRIIDRSRSLEKEARQTTEGSRSAELLSQQIRIMFKRAVVMRRVIVLASTSIFLVALTIMCLFAGHVLPNNVIYMLAISFFGFSLLALICSLAFFLKDIAMSLSALRLELQDHTG